MKKTFGFLTFLLFSFLISVGSASAHCEIPCGIYDDAMRVKMIYEHVTTIEKSMNMILSLEKESPINYNQLVRWVTNKENHASEIQDIISQYFLTQRIKPDQKAYTQKLTLLHQIMVSAMKCKQTTDPGNTEAIKAHLKAFEEMYFQEDPKHDHK